MQENKQYNLSRYIDAQKQDYPMALTEIKSGRKRNHWIWYIYPQLVGLSKSSTSQLYGLQGVEEAKAFLNDVYLGGNLKEISTALLTLKTNDAKEIFSDIDTIKLQSSMTLFAYICEANSIFAQVLEKFYNGKPDHRTLQMLEKSV